MRPLLALLLALASVSAHSAQRFSFASLTWGDSPKVVEEKLLAAGHSGLAPDSLYDITKNDDERLEKFSGQVASHPFKVDATFVDDKLIRVNLDWTLARPHERADDAVLQLLVIKYGKPGERGKSVDTFENFWRGGSGEELTLRVVKSHFWNEPNTLYVTYASPQAMRRLANNTARWAAEKRKADAVSAAASRAKAAGL